MSRCLELFHGKRNVAIPLGGTRVTRALNVVVRRGKHPTPATRAFQEMLAALSAS